jgi:hypothetical protein
MADVSRATEARWLANPSLNPMWPRPVPPLVPGGVSPYVLEEIEAYIEARIAARDAAHADAAQARPGNGAHT